MSEQASVALRIARCAGWSVAAMALAAGVTVALNALDEPLSVEARRLAAAAPQPEAETGNAYVWMLGLRAPATEDAYAWGARVLARLQEADGHGGQLDQRDPLLADYPADARDQEVFCVPEKGSCIDLVAERSSEVHRQLAQARVLLDRAAEMRSQPTFTDAYVPHSVLSPLPQYQNAARAQSATLLLASVAAVDGRFDQALALAQADMHFSRRMLAGSTNLVGKMVANTCVARNALFLSDLLSKRPTPMRSYSDRLAAAVGPLSPEESLLEPALRDEAAKRLRFLLTEVPRNGPLWVYRGAQAPRVIADLAALFYQPNVTANEATRRFEEDLAVAQVAAAQFDAVREASRASISAYRKLSVWDYLRNPAGNILVRSARNDYANYVARMHDLQGLITLVRAQVAMQALRSPVERAAFLASDRAKALANPYTGVPLSVDAATGELFFAPRSDGSWVKEVATQFGGTIRVGTLSPAQEAPEVVSQMAQLQPARQPPGRSMRQPAVDYVRDAGSSPRLAMAVTTAAVSATRPAAMNTQRVPCTRAAGGRPRSACVSRAAA